MSQPYLSLEAELHDAFWEAEDDGSEVRLMAAFLKKFPGKSLEIGSGSGRLMFPLLQLGFDLEGLELSKDMLALGKARAEQLGIELFVHEGDMSHWSNGQKFSSLLAPAFTLQLATDPERTLRHWRDLLEKTGGLYFTIFMPYAELMGDLPENEWYEDHQVTLADGRVGLLETRHRLDHAGQRLHREHRYSISNNPAVHHSRQTIRWFEHAEILELLGKCGFRADRFFLDFDESRVVKDPDQVDFDGILTYHATCL
ncbi:MAG: class I SAM-dependent methyltransferase [Akkermansiaceae bacterium]|nr:class I SAM-dependent methyltransferase [Akkermansiaceae bacterium]